MKNTTKEIALLVIALIPALLIAWFWNDMPDRIPIHWNIKGEVDGYGSKYTLIWGSVGLLGIGMYLLLRFIPKIDPKKTNHEKFQKTYGILRFVLGLVFFIMNCTIILITVGYDLNMGKILSISLSFMFIVLGNYMPKIKPNYLVGIRTPWTLDSDTVWKRTHQVGGKLVFYSGLVSFVLAIVLPEPYILISIFVPVTATLVAAVLSYVYFQQEKSSPKSTNEADSEH